jgi:hypothetical protein
MIFAKDSTCSLCGVFASFLGSEKAIALNFETLVKEPFSGVGPQVSWIRPQYLGPNFALDR